MQPDKQLALGLMICQVAGTLASYLAAKALLPGRGAPTVYTCTDVKGNRWAMSKAAKTAITPPSECPEQCMSSLGGEACVSHFECTLQLYRPTRPTPPAFLNFFIVSLHNYAHGFFSCPTGTLCTSQCWYAYFTWISSTTLLHHN